MFTFRVNALAYDGVNATALRTLVAAVGGLTWKITTESPTELVLDGTAAGLDPQQLTIPAGHFVIVQSAADGSTAIVASPAEFADRYAVLVDPAELPTLADVQDLQVRLARVEQVLAYPLSVEARLSA